MLVKNLREPVHHEVYLVVSDVAQQGRVVLMEVVAQGGERAPGVRTGDVIVVIPATGPGPVEARESPLGRKILGRAESLAPSAEHVAGVAHGGQMLGEQLEVQGQTDRLEVSRGNELLTCPGMLICLLHNHTV